LLSASRATEAGGGDALINEEALPILIAFLSRRFCQIQAAPPQKPGFRWSIFAQSTLVIIDLLYAGPNNVAGDPTSAGFRSAC
jgi:hypothetical protein